EFDRSRPRLIYELQNGLRHRTIPPLPQPIDWRDPDVVSTLDVDASEITLTKGVLSAEGERCFVLGLDTRTVGIEVRPPTDAEPPASVKWPRATTRRLWAESKIGEGIKKAQLARLLHAEAKKAVRAGQLSRVLKASYIENQLTA